MIHHETKWNPLSASDNSKYIPTAGVQIASAECFHCGRITRFPVRPEYVDWKIIAEEYRKNFEHMMSRFDKIVCDIDVMQPDDNPVRQYLHNEWMILLDEVRRKFGG